MSYQSNEMLKIAYECERHNGYHIHEDLCPVRIVDKNDNPLPPGRTGRIIVSNLVNRGTVLINYDQGDTGRINVEPCVCGRRFWRLELDETRDIPMLKTPDGHVIHPAEVLLFLDDNKEIDVVQIDRIA